MRAVIFLLPFILAFGPFDSPRGLVEKGNELFAGKRFDEAIQRYDRAGEITDKKAPLEYNRGNALLKKGDLDGALKALREAAANGDASLKAKSLYNMGNALFGAGKYAEAADAYRDALRGDPADVDAKVNLEMALKKIEEKEEEKKRQEKEQEKNKDSNDEGDEKDDAEGEKGGDHGDDDKKESSGRKGGGQPERRDMTKEEAERLLENLGGENMDLQNMADMVQKSGPARLEKDW